MFGDRSGCPSTDMDDPYNETYVTASKCTPGKLYKSSLSCFYIVSYFGCNNKYGIYSILVILQFESFGSVVVVTILLLTLGSGFAVKSIILCKILYNVLPVSH